jgi:hypothetical protein
MKYLSFIEDKKALAYVVGSPIEDIDRLEKDLGVRIPLVLREYLQMMGVKPMYSDYDEHGTSDMKFLHEWLHEYIENYRNEGFELNEVGNILPFDKLSDTFFYVPLDEGIENPPVMAFDLGAKPTIRKVTDCFTDFVKWKYEALLKELYLPK